MGRFVAQIYTKKEAQIEIQAVAKIQYPIKSHCNKANSSPNGFKGRISGFGVRDEEFRGFFSSVVHENLQFNPSCHRGAGRGGAIGGLLRGEVCAIGESFCCIGSCNFVSW